MLKKNHFPQFIKLQSSTDSRVCDYTTNDNDVCCVRESIACFRWKIERNFLLYDEWCLVFARKWNWSCLFWGQVSIMSVMDFILRGIDDLLMTTTTLLIYTRCVVFSCNHHSLFQIWSILTTKLRFLCDGNLLSNPIQRVAKDLRAVECTALLLFNL
jgi:hypothetical protein